MSSAREAREWVVGRPVDPIILWPGGSPQLATMIAEMQRLNPGLGLRCTSAGDLLYAGTDLDVVIVVMPEPPDDEMMSGFTEVNREWYDHHTDLGTFRSGPRRIERTPDGSLLIRPRSKAIEDIFGQFAWSYQDQNDLPLGEIGRLQSRWGIYHDPHELWEAEFAYLPHWVFNRGSDGKYLPPDPREPKSDHDYWRTIPIGTISYIDRYDLPLEAHFARAREIVALGAEFAIVGDVEGGALHIFRMSGVRRSFDDVRLPEMDWFEVPVRARWE